MSNYPDKMGDDSHLDSDETGEKLSCGCYEEQCECICEHEEFELTSEEADVDGVMTLNYNCNNCGALGVVVYQIGEIEWSEL